MGMYTELNIGVDLFEETPKEVMDILEYMLAGNHATSRPELPDHPLFKTERWAYMLVTDSAYFPGRTDSSLERVKYAGYYNLNVRCNLKNYDSEIELFLHWLRPYMDSHGFIGYMRYEEDDDPWLIYNDKYECTIVCRNVSYDNGIRKLYDKWLEDMVEFNTKIKDRIFRKEWKDGRCENFKSNCCDGSR